jgi:hypothetical protein
MTTLIRLLVSGVLYRAATSLTVAARAVLAAARAADPVPTRLIQPRLLPLIERPAKPPGLYDVLSVPAYGSVEE